MEGQDRRHFEIVNGGAPSCTACRCCRLVEGGCEGGCGLGRTTPAGRHSQHVEMAHPAKGSGRVEAAGYYPRGGLLFVRFTKGLNRLYAYYGVPRRKYEALMLADSPGKYLDDEIRNKYEFRREGMWGVWGEVPAGQTFWGAVLRAFRGMTVWELAQEGADLRDPLEADRRDQAMLMEGEGDA